MMPIKAPKIQLSPDQQVKQKAAVKQMQDLLKELSQWVKYRLLTYKDRQQLLRKGYARDLVDNLVYLTQRDASKGVTQKNDSLVTGFTEAAFDPSLYASHEVTSALHTANCGCCSWCEKLIESSDAIVSHYRPPYGYSQFHSLHRSHYYSLAYEHSNLFYSCFDCAEKYKGSQFPVIGCERVPQVPVEQERAIIINPYLDDPRQYIRFNPMNGAAYPYDQVLQFYQDEQGKGASTVDAMLWGDPGNIPLQKDCNGQAISSSMVDGAFCKWLHQQTGHVSDHLSRGRKTIDTLGLNRPSLLRARNNHLRQLRALYLAQFSTEGETEIPGITELVKSLGVLSDDNGAKVPEFVSLTLDAINTWLAEANSSSSDDKTDKDDNTTQKASIDWQGNYTQALAKAVTEHHSWVPSNIRSGLCYIVLEHELGLKNKRRIVHLHCSDLLYSSITGRCVFLPINWHTDIHNVIKVHEGKHTWETSFAELFSSRPGAVQSLFAHSEVWAEGEYEGLI